MKTSSTAFQSVSGIVAVSALLIVGVGLTGVVGESKAFWFLSRASGLVAYTLLWISVMAGLLISSRARSLVSPKTAVDIHQMTSGTALAFALFHGLILSGDRFVSLSLVELLVPWTGSFRPGWMAAGQIAVILVAAVLATSSLRRQLGNKVWRTLHYSSFLAYWLALSHALVMGSDSERPFVIGLYALTGAAVLWLTTARIFIRESDCGR
jgi:predicted ferric reductase